MTRVIAALAAVVLSLAACASSGGPATPDPAIAFCPALATYSQTLVKLDALTPSATVEEYKKAVADAKAALLVLTPVAQPYAGAQLAAATQAQQDLEYAAGQLPAGTTPTQAESTLQPYLVTLIQAIEGVRVASCNTRPTPSAAT